MSFTTVSSAFCRIISLALILFAVVPAYSLPSQPMTEKSEKNNGLTLNIFADKKKKKIDEQRVWVHVSGVLDPLLSNIYNRLSIYRLRSNKRLKQVSVNQLYRQAESDIKGALAPYGYYNPVIHSSLAELPRSETGGERWKAEFNVEKGPPVIVENVDLQLIGNGKNNPVIQKQLHSFALKKGYILNQEIYENEKKKLINTAISEGYLNGSFVHSKLRVDPDSNKAWIELTMETGEIFRFGDTHFTTSPEKNAFSEKILQGYLPYTTGDPYSMGKLFELQSILYQTDYFTNVMVNGKVSTSVDDSIPVDVSLMIPDENNKYTVGTGYATDTGARAVLHWKNRMLSSSGDKMNADLEIAQKEKSLYLTYEQPRWQDPRYDKYVLTSSYQDKTWYDTTTKLLTASAGRDYSGPLFNLAGGLEIREEAYDVGDTSGNAILLLPYGTAGLVMADNVINTQNGLRLYTGAKGAMKSILSDASFFQWTLGGKAIITPYKDWRLIGRAVFGMTVVDSIDSIPPSLRFYTGGDSSVRGYAYKSLGAQDSSGTVVGGKYLSVQSIEMERLIGEYFGVAAFWDVGTATNDLSLNYSQGAGVGFRVRLPFGEIKLDVASAITESDYPIRIHFSVGGDL